MAERGFAMHGLGFARDVEDAKVAEVVRRRKLVRHVGPKLRPFQSHVDHRDIGAAQAHESDGVRDVRCDPTYFMCLNQQQLLKEVGHH